MLNPRSVLVAVVVSFVVVACGSEPPPPPEPVDEGPTAEELERMRQDSIDAANAAAEAERRRQEEEARRQAELAAQRAQETLTEMVFFEYDEASLTSETEGRLRAKLEILRNNPGVQLRMEGHADERGTSEYNIALGNERAESVIQFLTNFGLDAGRFTAVSYGEERPLASGSNEASWARNRRVEFVITAGGDGITG